MTVCFFDKLTGQFSILLSKLLSTCPEVLFDSFFQNILSTFLSEWEQMFSDFWQIASGSVVKIAFWSSRGLLRGVFDERNMKLEAQFSRIFRHQIFDGGVETEIVVSSGINEELLNFE